MDVVLGVAVADRVARLALVGSAAEGAGVIDQSMVDLADSPIEKLTETVVGTNRLLADQHHRLVGTRLCWSDHPKAHQLRQMLEDSGVQNVVVLDEPQAATALMRTAVPRGSAVLLVGEEAATLLAPAAKLGDEDSPPTVLSAGSFAGSDATGALDTMMARLGDQAGGVHDVYLVGSSSELTSQVADQLRDGSTMRVAVPEDPAFALARGAAISALPPTMAQSVLLTGDATAMSPQLRGDATAMSPQLGQDATAMSPQAWGADATAMAPHAPFGDGTAMVPNAPFGGDATAYVPPMADMSASDQQLAYSMTEDHELLPVEMDEYGDEFDDEEAETGQLKLSRGSLLIGNAVVAFAVIGLASLAVAVAVAVRPTAASEPVVGHQNAAPGKFMPLLPTQQQAPVPAPAPDSPNIGYQGGIIPDVNGYIPPQLAAPSGGGAPAGGAPAAPQAPAPQAPAAPVAPAPVPGFVPDPRMPIPVPIFIPFPGWRPPPIFIPPPFLPPVPIMVTPTGPTPSIPTGPSKQPLVPTTAPVTPPTASAPVTTPPVTSKPPTPSATPQPTSAPPPSPKQTTVAPAPTTQAPVPTTQHPVPTTVAPVPTAPHTVAPVPTVAPPAPHTQPPPVPHTQAPIQPQPPMLPRPTRHG